MNEIFKPISDYPKYEVSNMGQVRNAYTGKLLLNTQTNRGYLVVTLYKHKASKQFRIHRLVACEFIANPGMREYVNHIDGCKTNNTVENLEWCTHTENVTHGWKTNLYKQTYILSVEDVAEIKKSKEAFVSISEMSRHYKLDRKTIRKVLTDKYFKVAKHHAPVVQPK